MDFYAGDLQKAGGFEDKKKERDQATCLNPSPKHSHRTSVSDGGRNGTLSGRRPIPIYLKILKVYPN